MHTLLTNHRKYLNIHGKKTPSRCFCATHKHDKIIIQSSHLACKIRAALTDYVTIKERVMD